MRYTLTKIKILANQAFNLIVQADWEGALVPCKLLHFSNSSPCLSGCADLNGLIGISVSKSAL